MLCINVLIRDAFLHWPRVNLSSFCAVSSKFNGKNTSLVKLLMGCTVQNSSW